MIYLLEVILALYCTYFVFYTLFFVTAGLFYRGAHAKRDIEDYQSIAVLVPAYRCDEVILHSVKKNLSINYPKNKWKLFVISDGLKPETNNKLSKLPIRLVKVQFEQSTKVRSLKKCLEEEEMNNYNSIVILDADNLMDLNFLFYMNQKLQSAGSVQGNRVAANRNNSLAVLDGVSEAINTMVFRQGATSLGLSVSLSGSGMAFHKSTFKEVIDQMDSIGGFDRELEYELLSRGIKSHYLKEAVVMDEKTDDISNFKNQRKRWLSSHFYYIRRYFKKGIFALFTGKFSYFHSTVLRNFQLPRILNIGLLTLITVFAIFLSFYGYWHWKFWSILWIVHSSALLLAIPRGLYNKELLGSLIKLPGIFISLFLLLFKLKGANKKFIHTIHKTRNNNR